MDATAEIPVYIKVKGLGTLLSDSLSGFNEVTNKFYKMALFNGKHRVVESSNRNGPWVLKNDGLRSLKPTRIVYYKNDEE